MKINNLMESVVCSKCRGNLYLDNDLISCVACNKNFSIKEGVIQFLEEDDSFYEGVYVRQIKYIPKGNILKNWGFFNLVQSGVLGEIKKTLPLGGKVLDVGCGGGVKWLGLYADAVGMELSQGSLIEARKCYSLAIRGDIQNMPFRDSSFDVVYGSYVFEHLSVDAKENFLKEAYRILKPGGTCILQFDALSNNWLTRFALQDKAAFKKGFIDKDGHIGLEPLSIGIKRIESSGMEISRVVKFGTTFLQYQATYNWLNIAYGDKHRWIQYLSRAVNWILSKRLGIALEFFVTAVDKLINPFSNTDCATRAIVIARKPQKA